MDIVATPLPQADILIVGLGPGDRGSITQDAFKALHGGKVFLRTRIHPTVQQLLNQNWNSFDYLYEQSESFMELYQAITWAVINAAKEAKSKGHHIVYAVPGNPYIGEATTRLIQHTAEQQSLTVRVIPGMSFLDAAAALIPGDIVSENCQVVDGLDLNVRMHEEPFAGGNLPISPLRPALISQVYDQRIASGIKLALMRLYPDDHPITVLQAAGNVAMERVATVPLAELDHGRVIMPDHLTTLYVPKVEGLERSRTADALQQIMARLRAPEGCPWDREQTHASLRPNMIEETYEAVDAIDADDSESLREELGDLLLQVTLHAQIAEEAGEFTLEDVYETVNAKLIRRHPHVFGEATAADAKEVLGIWQDAKRKEKQAAGESATAQGAPGSRQSADGKSSVLSPQSSVLFGGLPRSMPGLAYSQAMQERAARVGFEWPNREGVLEKLREELDELAGAKTPEHQREELGDILFVLVDWARWHGIESEDAMRAANAKFYRRFGVIERNVAASGRDWSSFTLDELESFWQQVKAEERAMSDGK
ncbi:MAG: nucleoside triphosphate pyrophosphohydrolase [Thermomicrobiales bacterium]